MTLLNNNISFLIDKNRFNQDEIAELLDVSRGMISSWIRGKASPKYDKLLLISEKFNVSCDDLLKKDLSKEKGVVGLVGAAPIPTVVLESLAEDDLQYNTQLKQQVHSLILQDADIGKAIRKVVKDGLLIE